MEKVILVSQSSLSTATLWQNIFLRFIPLDIFYSCHNNCNQRNGLNNMHLLCYSSGGQKSEMGLTGLKSRCQQGCIPSGGSRREFPAFFRTLEAVHIPRLMAPLPPFSKPAILYLSDHSSIVTSPSGHSWESFPAFLNFLRIHVIMLGSSG